MFCDDCDRGFHTFCVGLDALPEGKWVCEQCETCASCGKTGVEIQRMYDERDPEHMRFLQLLCKSCAPHFKKGQFCPLCLKVYRNTADDSRMICCDQCDRWVHTECDGITDAAYKKLSKAGSNYVCGLCNERQPERFDAFHKKWRKRSARKAAAMDTSA